MKGSNRATERSDPCTIIIGMNNTRRASLGIGWNMMAMMKRLSQYRRTFQSGSDGPEIIAFLVIAFLGWG